MTAGIGHEPSGVNVSGATPFLIAVHGMEMKWYIGVAERRYEATVLRFVSTARMRNAAKYDKDYCSSAPTGDEKQSNVLYIFDFGHQRLYDFKQQRTLKRLASLERTEEAWIKQRKIPHCTFGLCSGV